MKKEYPVIEVPSDGRKKWSDGAYCMLFVYSKYDGNFILKGYLREVDKYLKENYTHYFYYRSMWSNKISRGYWSFWKERVHFFEGNKSKREKFRVVKFDETSYETKKEVELKFKRLPKRWIPEFDKL